MLETLEPLRKLTRDLKNASVMLGDHEARFLVDSYYALQDFRMQSHAQVRTLSEAKDDKAPEPHETLLFFAEQFEALEEQIKKALDPYSTSKASGRWARSVVGIGPVIAAGLLAYIDIARTPSPSSLWRFAGLDPTSTWKKGEKRPWNASLKVLCWKIGESFVKVSNNPKDFYGKEYAKRKALEIERNDTGALGEQAERILATKRIGKNTDAYKSYSNNVLPPAHIHARAKRYAVKLFLSHFWKVTYEATFGKTAPRAYVLEHGGHVHEIQPPGWKSP